MSDAQVGDRKRDTFRAFQMRDTSGIARTDKKPTGFAPGWIKHARVKKGVSSIASHDYFKAQSVEQYWCRKKYRQKDDTWSFSVTRYSTGEFNVLYTADTYETALREVTRWVKIETSRHSKLPNEVTLGAYPVTIYQDLALDLMNPKPYNPMLVHPTDYDYCHKIAEDQKDAHPVFIAPSARDFDGICVPSFKRAVAEQGDDEIVFTLKLDPDDLEYHTTIEGKPIKIDIHDVYGRVG